MCAKKTVSFKAPLVQCFGNFTNYYSCFNKVGRINLHANGTFKNETVDKKTINATFFPECFCDE